MSDEELLKEVQKGMEGGKINQAIYESYYGMDITAKDIDAELKNIKSADKSTETNIKETPKAEKAEKSFEEKHGVSIDAINKEIEEFKKLGISNPIDMALTKLGFDTLPTIFGILF